ncbi:hypothetical protein HELRODRAFT_170483 [Helobdella robusta]|uniref:Tyrosine-protein kinase ephrin type A/B receptor-like domain-containing protein n=1 Tax=Helobdella robusta TaxID=6412 RepID=T1F342_HELRO|nr:hypothetical protein HELRODRAFT_170483 [Helobdella robusta]ESO07173.1 hypothetical protein HELRODRAFT_170483 [Helobdella robusta]
MMKFQNLYSRYYIIYIVTLSILNRRCDFEKEVKKTYRNSMVKIYTSITIPCMPTTFGQPDPNLAEWIGPPGIIVSPITNERVTYDKIKNLKLQNITTSLTGAYTCVVKFENVTYVNYVFLVVYKVPYVGLEVPLVFKVSGRTCPYALHNIDDLIVKLTDELCRDIPKNDPNFDSKCRFQIEPSCQHVDPIELMLCPFLNQYQCYGLKNVKKTIELACLTPPYDSLCNLVMNTLEPLKHVAKSFCRKEEQKVICWHDGEDQEPRLMAKLCSVRPLLTNCKRYKKIHDELNLDKNLEVPAVTKSILITTQTTQETNTMVSTKQTLNSHEPPENKTTTPNKSSNSVTSELSSKATSKLMANHTEGTTQSTADKLDYIRKKRKKKRRLDVNLWKRSLMEDEEHFEFENINSFSRNALLDSYKNNGNVKRDKKFKKIFNFTEEAQKYLQTTNVETISNRVERVKKNIGGYKNQYLILKLNYYPAFQVSVDTTCIDECVYLKNLDTAHNETEELRKLWDNIDGLPEKPAFLHFVKGNVRKYSYKYVHYCSPGYYFPSQHSHMCLPCMPGQFSRGGSHKSCERCPVDTYQAEWGSYGCIKCPGQTETGLESGQTNQLSCFNYSGVIWSLIFARVFFYLALLITLTAFLLAISFVIIHCTTMSPKLNVKKRDIREAKHSKKIHQKKHLDDKIKQKIEKKEKLTIYNKRNLNDPITRPDIRPGSISGLSSISISSAGPKDLGKNPKTALDTAKNVDAPSNKNKFLKNFTKKDVSAKPGKPNGMDSAASGKKENRFWNKLTEKPSSVSGSSTDQSPTARIT